MVFRCFWNRCLTSRGSWSVNSIGVWSAYTPFTNGWVVYCIFNVIEISALCIEEFFLGKKLIKMLWKLENNVCNLTEWFVKFKSNTLSEK